MVSDDDAGEVPEDAAPPAVEVIGLAVHEVRPRREEDLEVRPLEVRPLALDPLEVRPLGIHELPGALRLVRPGDQVPAGLGAQAAVVGTSALRLVPASQPEGEGEGDVVAAADLEPDAAPPAPAPAPALAPAPPGPVRATAPRRVRRRGRPLLPWLRRRLWAVVLLAVAGVAGGFVVTKGHHGSYSSQVLLEVRPGNTPANPGGAQEASALAVTYAALVPSDTAVVTALAARLHLSSSAVASGLSATAESGTGLFVVTYAAPSAAQAIAGANEAGSILASAAPPGLAIVKRSVAVVKPAASAKHGKDMRLYGLVGGAVGGTLLGFVLLLALERVDARVDDPEDAAAAADCPATRWPGGMSPGELAVALGRAAPNEPVTLVAVTAAARSAAAPLADALASSSPGAEAAPPAVVTLDESPGSLGEASGPTVVVVRAGEPVRAVSDACARLRLLGRPPVFAVVAARG